MSLDYHLPNGMTNADISDEDWNKFTSLCFSTMSVGISRLTNENLDEFWTRYLMMEVAYRDRNPILDRDFIERFIGLSTNASPLTKFQFDKRIATAVRENTERWIRDLDMGIKDL